MIHERQNHGLPGLPVLLLLLALEAFLVWMLIGAIRAEAPGSIVGNALAIAF